ncbi:hypothetical protein [Actinomycetospora flava]|uniref:AAA domain-containing protein n=1 Tax=Actinomycetospora flava TaxID=3129232 RepID=A0ABU8M0K9_9PSEU
MSGPLRRVLFVLGEHGLGKTTTMTAAVNARHGEPVVLDPDRLVNANGTRTAAPPCHGYGARDERGRLPVVEVYRLRFAEASPTQVMTADRDAQTYVASRHAEAETSCLVAHRAWNKLLPRWLSVAAACGWEVHAVMLSNPELAQQRRLRRYALRLALDTPLRRSFRCLTSGWGRAVGAQMYDMAGLRGMLIGRAVDSVGRDRAETLALYAQAEAAPGVRVHIVDVAAGDSPATVAGRVAAATGMADVLGPAAETPVAAADDDPVAAIPLYDARASAVGDPSVVSDPARRDDLILHGLGMMLDAHDDGLLPASPDDLAVLVAAYDELAAVVDERASFAGPSITPGVAAGGAG